MRCNRRCAHCSHHAVLIDCGHSWSAWGRANYAAANAMLNRLSDIETASGDSSDINLGSSHQRISTALSDRPCCIIILPGEKVFHVVSRMRRENWSPRGFCHLLQNHATVPLIQGSKAQAADSYSRL